MPCGNSIFIISCPVPHRLVHGMLWHWLDLQRGWPCISYFYIPNVSDVDLRAEMSCVWSVCWGSPRVPPGVSSSNYILTLLEGVKQDKPRPLLPPTNNLEGCDMYLRRGCWLKGNPVSHWIMCIVDDVWMLSAAIKLCIRCTWVMYVISTPYFSQQPVFLTTARVSHNSPCFSFFLTTARVAHNSPCCSQQPVLLTTAHVSHSSLCLHIQQFALSLQNRNRKAVHMNKRWAERACRVRG